MCWLPQALKIIRDREMWSISLLADRPVLCAAWRFGLYGIALIDWPGDHLEHRHLALMMVIFGFGLKLRHG